MTFVKWRSNVSALFTHHSGCIVQSSHNMSPGLFSELFIISYFVSFGMLTLTWLILHQRDRITQNIDTKCMQFCLGFYRWLNTVATWGKCYITMMYDHLIIASVVVVGASVTRYICFKICRQRQNCVNKTDRWSV